MLKFFDEDPGPGMEKFGSRIRNTKLMYGDMQPD